MSDSGCCLCAGYEFRLPMCDEHMAKIRGGLSAHPFPNPFDECNCEGHGMYCEKCRPKLAANDAAREWQTVVPRALLERVREALMFANAEDHEPDCDECAAALAALDALITK